MPTRSALKPRKLPTQARSKATVEAILGGAAQVFKKVGYAAATTDRIAGRAGVSVGSVYQYFPNKDAILVALTERHIDAGFRLVRELLSKSLVDLPSLEILLRKFVLAMIALHEHEPELHRVLFEEAPLPASLRRQLRKRENEFASEVAVLLEAHPEVRVLDTKLAAYLLVQAVDALVHNSILHPPTDISPQVLTDEAVNMLSAYLKG